MKLIITILQKYATGLQMFAGIETKFKFKLQTKKTEKIKETETTTTTMGQFP
jgi:hypothetical protein